ncbi:MAG: metallophosphoesterase family protein [Chloroflexota bacterium]
MSSIHVKRLSLKSGRVGLIADTHGLLRPEALAALKGSDLIIHAGDIGKPEVLMALNTIAPVAAIRGNNDRYPAARKLPDVLNLQINGVKVRVIHNVKEIESDLRADGYALVVSGHSHKPGVTKENGVLFINPGSAGPRRFKLPVTVARLSLGSKSLDARIIELKV